MQTKKINKKWNFMIFVNNLTYRFLTSNVTKITFLQNDIYKFFFWKYTKKQKIKQIKQIKKLFKNFIWSV